MELDDNKIPNGLVPEEENEGKETANSASESMGEEVLNPEDISEEKTLEPDKREENETQRANDDIEIPKAVEELSEKDVEELLEASLKGGDLQQVEHDAESQKDTIDEESYDGPRCIRCRTPVSAGVDYCMLCSHEIRKVPLRAGGVLVAILMLFISLFAVILFVPSMDIYSKVLKGDIKQRQDNYSGALESYNAADTAASDYNKQFNSALGDKTFVYFSAGQKTIFEKIKATKVYAGTLEAGNLIETNYADGKVPRELKDINEQYQKIKPTLTAVQQLYKDYFYDYMSAKYYGTEFTGKVSYEEFSKKLDDAAAKNPGYVKYIVEYFRFVASSITSEDEQVQLKNLLKVKELAPDEHWIYCSELMQLYFSMKNYEKTIEIADIAIKNNYQTAPAYIFKAEALYSSGKYEECVKVAEEDIAKNPDTATTYVYKIRSLYLMGKKDEAFKYCDTLYKGEDTSSSYYAIKAELYRMEKNYDKALAVCKEGLKIDDENIELYRQQAIIYMLKGDTASAKTALTKGYDLGATLELVHTIAIYSIIADDETWYKEIDQLLTSNNLKMPQTVLDFKAGKVTLEDIYVDGKGDVS
jgi:tetratricopeptide (TPR) repeat protein